MNGTIFLYIAVMAGVTYLIRLLPLLLIRKDIENVYIKSFLYYIPYVTLAVMTFPAILYATANIWSAAAGFFVAILFAYRESSLFKVAIFACLTVFIMESVVLPLVP